ncbi:unnamed protein product [Auanema sp. JU1783]|nr:unnamed protein product [Auanema sp. JU1783]
MRGEVSELPADIAEGLSVEKQQEQQLMNKLAATGKLPARPASSFLQKKLQQRKFFDSGDYAMDKNKGLKSSGGPHPLTVNSQTTPQKQEEPASPEPDGNLQIPRPDTVPQRKASIINPSVHCKLQPLPHVQHHDSQPSADE